MSQEQAQVSKTKAAQGAARRRRHRAGDEPDSPYWQPPWYQPQDPRSGDEDT
jgi:hypothetical protein